MTYEETCMNHQSNCAWYYREKAKLLEEKKKWRNPKEQIPVRYKNEKEKLLARLGERTLRVNQSDPYHRVIEVKNTDSLDHGDGHPHA